MTHVKEIMTVEPAFCTAHTTLPDVARIMRDADCGAVPVVDADELEPKLVGIITDRDIVVRSVAEGINPHNLTAGDCMSMVVATVTPDMTIDECARIMEEHQVRRLPVVDGDGVCCGIVAQADLALHAPLRAVGEVVREVSQPGPGEA